MNYDLRFTIYAAFVMGMTSGFSRVCFAQLPPATGSTNTLQIIDLPSALRLAGAQNLDVQIARARLDEARANHESALEQFFPWLSAGGAYRRHEGRVQDTTGAVFDADKQLYTAGGALTAQWDLGDAIYKSLAAKQLVKAADSGLDSQREDAILAAAQGYFELTKAQGIVEVARESLRISSDYQNQLHEAVGAGIAFKGDELRVQVQSERYEIALRQSLEQQRIAAARLAQTLHLDPSVELAPRDAGLAPITLFETNAALHSLVELALRSRPELKQNQAIVLAEQNQRKGAAYGPLIPSVSAGAFGGGLGGGIGESTGNFSASEDYFVGVGWRIGPGGLFDFGRVNASKSRLRAAQLDGDKVRDDIIRDDVENHTLLQSPSDQIPATERNLETSAEALRLTHERKQFGVGAVLEDIQAQQDAARARSDYLNVIADYNKAQYGLSHAVRGAHHGP